MKNPDKLYQGVHNNLFHTIAQHHEGIIQDDASLNYLYKTMAETISSGGVHSRQDQIPANR